jgi:hypothetical protein
MYFLVRVWIMFSALLVGAGWILSAIHQLNRAGYAVVLGLAALLFLCKKKLPNGISLRRLQQKFRKRFRRPAPFLFLVLALLSLFAGSLYGALNWDTNAYRLPRIFHWLWNEQWHWIRTADPRMNIIGCGFEWLSAPLILFSHTDRLLFLINWISYLMLPGLIFSVFTRLEVRPRVAWWWMWFLAAGWCFLFQASSSANDSFGVVYALAAIDLALRAGKSKKIADLWLSLLAIALATGVKQTDIPLALLWLVAAWPGLSLFSKHRWKTAAVFGMAALVSIVPISIFNLKHFGTWLPVENPGIKAIGQFHLNPFWGISGNAFCIPAQNLLPPFYELVPPFYYHTVEVWNRWMSDFVQTPFGSHFISFENFGFWSGTREHGISEANAGLGLGISLLLAISALEAFVFRRQEIIRKRNRFLFLVRATAWVGLLIFMAKVGSYENARQLAPYYPFLLPAFLVMRGHSILVRRRHWQWIGLTTMIFSALLVITSTKRPLFPAEILVKLVQKFPGNKSIRFEAIEYLGALDRGVEIRRECIQKALPDDPGIVGYYVGISDGDEPAIWLPYGQRSVKWIFSQDSPQYVRSLGIHYVVICSFAFAHSQETFEGWTQKYNARLIAQFDFLGQPMTDSALPNFNAFYLVQLN